jgi:adenosylcobinamide-GDP ribazoletransferase
VEGAGNEASALVAAHVLGRWSSLPLIYRYEYVREGAAGEARATGKPFAASVTVPRLASGTAIAVAVTAAALGARALPALAAAAAVTALGGRYFRRAIGGITGDCLGAANQMVELATYLVLAFHLRTSLA